MVSLHVSMNFRVQGHFISAIIIAVAAVLAIIVGIFWLGVVFLIFGFGDSAVKS